MTAKVVHAFFCCLWQVAGIDPSSFVALSVGSIFEPFFPLRGRSLSGLVHALRFRFLATRWWSLAVLLTCFLFFPLFTASIRAFTINKELSI